MTGAARAEAARAAVAKERVKILLNIVGGGVLVFVGFACGGVSLCGC